MSKEKQNVFEMSLCLYSKTEHDRTPVDGAFEIVNKYLGKEVSMYFSFGLDAAAPQEYAQTVEEEEEESPNYEEKAQEIVQSILQEVVNTVAGGELLLCEGELNWWKRIKCLRSLLYIQSHLFFSQCSCLCGAMLTPNLNVHFTNKCKTQCKTDPMQIE